MSEPDGATVEDTESRVETAAAEAPSEVTDPPASDSPRLTIVVPTYQRPDLLVQCLRAIADQTFRDFVVLVCDNSPEMEADAVVAGLRDDRFVYIPRGRNIGMLANVLTGFRAATTPLVMEVDDDDLLYPHCVESLVAPFTEQPDLTVVFGDLDVINDSLQVLPHDERVAFQPSLDFLHPGRHQPFTDLAARGMIFLPASVLRRDAIDWNRVHESAATAYDRHLGLAAARNGAPGYFVKSPLMAYRVHERSDALQFMAENISGAIEVLSSEELRSKGPARHSMSRELARSRIRLLRTHITMGHALAALGLLVKLLAPASLVGLTHLLVDDYLPALAGRSPVGSVSGSLKARLFGPVHQLARSQVPGRTRRPRP